MLRQWRERRRLSQLDLSIQADISARHLSFVETGRSRPSPEMIRQVLTGHNPYPAVVVNRWWELLDGNDAISILVSGCAQELLRPPVNVLRLSLHPNGMAPRILNLAQWRGHLLTQLQRRAVRFGDARLMELYDELRDYPGGMASPSSPADVVLLLQYRHGEQELSLFSIAAVIDTAADVTVDELTIESFYPANATTAAALSKWVNSDS